MSDKQERTMAEEIAGVLAVRLPGYLDLDRSDRTAVEREILRILRMDFPELGVTPAQPAPEISTLEVCRRQLRNILYCCNQEPPILVDSIRVYVETALKRIKSEAAPAQKESTMQLVEAHAVQGTLPDKLPDLRARIHPELPDRYAFDWARRVADEKIHPLIVAEVGHSISLSLMIAIAEEIRLASRSAEKEGK